MKRKGLLGVVALLVVCIAGYLLMQRAVEQRYRAYLAKSAEQLADVGLSWRLDSYQHRPFGASAVYSLTTAEPIEGFEWLDRLRFESLLHFGPLVRLDGQWRVGLLGARDTLLVDALGGEATAMARTLFGDRSPLEGEALIGFDDRVDYVLRINPVAFAEGDDVVRFAGLTMRGDTDMQTLTGSAYLSGGEIHIDYRGTQFSLSNISGQGTFQDSLGNTPLGDLLLVFSDLHLAAPMQPPIQMDLHLRQHSRVEKGLLDSTLEIWMEQLQSPALADTPLASLDRLYFSLGTLGLGAEGLEALDPMLRRMQTLTEATEGDDMQAAMDAAQALMPLFEEMLQLVTQRILQPGRSAVTASLLASAEARTLASVQARADYAGLPPSVTSLQALGEVSPQGWLRVVDINVDAELDAALVEQMPPAWREQAGSVLHERDDRLGLTLTLHEGGLWLNDEALPTEQTLGNLQQLFKRDAAAGAEGDVAMQFGEASSAISLDIEGYFYEDGRLPARSEAQKVVQEFAADYSLPVRLGQYDAARGVLELALMDQGSEVLTLRMQARFPGEDDDGLVYWQCRYVTVDESRYALWYMQNCETLTPVAAFD